MHISLVEVVVKTFELLSFADRAERASGQSLRLSSCEDCTAVDSRKYTYFAPNRTNFGKFSSVGTYAVVQDLCTDFLFLR